MYCVLNREPCQNDCTIKHFKLFEAHYGCPDSVKFTEICDSILSNPPLGPPVDGDKDFIHLDAEDGCYGDIAWFQATFGKMVLRPGIKFVGRGQNLETVGNFGVYATSQDRGLYDEEDEAEAIEEVEDVAELGRYSGNAYQGQMSRYTILTGMIKTNGDNNMVSKVLDLGIEQMTKAIASRSQKEHGASSDIVGLLELDERQKDRRLRPAQSPERKKTKSN